MMDVSNSSKKDDDSNGMVSINIGGSSVSSEPAGREYLDKRRRKQTRDNVAMLGVLESIGDDDSYVEDTLASLEYSVATSHGSFLREIAETTAPYTGSMPRWQYWLRRVSRKTTQWGRKILHRHRVPVQKYGPYFVVAMVYMTIRLVLSDPATSYSDTEKITLNTYRDSYQNQLQPRVGGAGSAQGQLNGAAVMENIAATQYPPLYKSKYQVKDTQDDDPMALPPNKSGQSNQESNQQQPQLSIEFKERVKKLREVSERGRAALGKQKPPPQPADKANSEQVQVQQATPEKRE